MQLDNTTITIRERNMFEILDVSLRVVTTHYKPLLWAGLLGVLPFATANAWMLSQMTDSLADEDTIFRYVFWSLIWIGLSAPLATAPITLVLGQILFQAEVSYRRLVRDLLRSLPQLLLLQGLLRLICFFPAFVTILVPYVYWPYLTEVILLERNPLSARNTTHALSTWQRTKALHKAASGELFARWIGVSAAAATTFASLTGAMYVLARQFETPAEPLAPATILGLATVAAWMTTGFTAVVRFLAYLDLRIRREGWEVELTMRAEGIRMRDEWHYA